MDGSRPPRPDPVGWVEERNPSKSNNTAATGPHPRQRARPAAVDALHPPRQSRAPQCGSERARRVAAGMRPHRQPGRDALWRCPIRTEARREPPAPPGALPLGRASLSRFLVAQQETWSSRGGETPHQIEPGGRRPHPPSKAEAALSPPCPRVGPGRPGPVSDELDETPHSIRIRRMGRGTKPVKTQ